MTTRDSTPAVTSSLRANRTEPASEAPAWRDLVLQGGRVTKYKGIACGTAPQSGVVFAVLGAAAMSTVALGVVVLSGSAAYAGACSTADNTNYECSGGAGAPGTDTPIVINDPNALTITTAPGFGIDASATAISIHGSGTGDVTFMDTNQSTITGALNGIYFAGGNAGTMNIISNGVITSGSNFAGINAVMTGASTGLTIDVNQIDADGHGINMFGNSGTGDVSVTANIIEAGGNGIHVDNGPGTRDFTVDVNRITSGGDGIYGFVSGNGDVNITVHDLIDADANGIWIDVDASANAGLVNLDIGDIEAGNEGINIETNANTAGLEIKVNDVTSGGSAIRFNHFGSGDTIVTANDIDVTSGHGIWFNTWGDGDVKVTAHDIDASGIGVYMDSASTTKDLIIDVNSITSGDDGINAVHSGDGTVDITVRDSIVSGDDAIEFYADNGAVKQINVDVNNAKGADNGIYIVNHSDAVDPNDPNAVNNDLNITTRGNIEAGAGWAIYTDTDPGVLTNITVKSTSVIESASGHAIFNADGDSHVIIENAAEIVDDPNTVEIEKNSVNGIVRLGWGGDRLDLHGGFSGITEVNGGHGGTDSDDVLNLFDATSTYNANNIIGWDVFNISNSYLTLDGGLGNLNVGTAGVAGTGIFLTNGSTLESNQHGLNILGNLTLDAGTTFLSDVNNDAGNPGRGDTYITGFLTNAGTVSIADGAADDDLAVWGLYTGNNGTVIIDTVLGGDTSATDTMTFSGGTAVGTTSVVVNNVGGLGAQTANGIKIIDVSGVSDGTFSLIGHYEVAGQQAVIAGAYGYTLWKNGVNTPNDGDWYLRSQSAAGGLIYQPGTPVFEAYPQVLLGLNGLSTLQQRVGNRMWSGNGAGVVSQGADAVAEQAPVEEGASPFIEGRGIWGRIEGAHANIDPSVSTTGSEYDFNTLKFQAGLDIQVLENGSGVLVGGVTVHYGHASADVSSPSGDGSISTDGFGVGGTLTWYGNNGFYVDAQGQVSWYDSDLASGQLGTLTSGNDATGYALSLETGKRIELNNGLTLTPQAQLVYSSVDFDTFTQTLGGQDIADVSLLDGDSLRGRLGISLDREASWQADNGLLSRSHVYGIANLHYEFLDGTAVDVSDAAFSTRSDRLWGGVGLGGSYNWNDDKFSLYGEGSVNTSLEKFADSYELKGTAGLRVSW